MAINLWKAFLFVGGGSAAAAGMAYVSGALDPYLNGAPPAEVASLTPPASKPAEPATAGGLPRAPAAASDAMAPAAPATGTDAIAPAAAAPATADATAPTFDVVRVESNGSVVVAGNASPNARVEILDGSKVLGSTPAGPDGAFAIVLDDPLKPGDYSIMLRSTAGDVVSGSKQTAVVSIPRNPTGQVLAMVEEPGKPSELLTVPAPETKSGAPAAGDQAAGTDVLAPATAPAATPEAAAPGAPAPSAVEVAQAPASAPPAAAATGPKIVVEAVEIDGKKIFVAGVADPGRKVRAYANDILLGDAKTSPDGHFLVEATRDVPVGTYTIHVDALDSDGVKVVARAAVPFEREAGESIAAVAPSETKPAEAKPADATKPTETQAAETKSAETTAPATATAEAAKPATPAPATEAPAKVTETTPSTDVPETMAPKLEHADGAVIIRRNDTLWRISRRVYGHGVRYSTIYLANQDQIRDPDRIWPGQVFKVPGKSKEGETADMKAMGDQMTTPPAKPE